jgi:hypothetical protein
LAGAKEGFPARPAGATVKGTVVRAGVWSVGEGGGDGGRDRKCGSLLGLAVHGSNIKRTLRRAHLHLTSTLHKHTAHGRLRSNRVSTCLVCARIDSWMPTCMHACTHACIAPPVVPWTLSSVCTVASSAALSKSRTTVRSPVGAVSSSPPSSAPAPPAAAPAAADGVPGPLEGEEARPGRVGGREGGQARGNEERT